MVEQKTKEELLIENAELAQEVDDLSNKDEEMRRELSIILSLSSVIVVDRFSTNEEPRVSSWFEITAEIGKLLAKEKVLNLGKKIDEMDQGLRNLYKFVEEGREKRKMPPINRPDRPFLFKD